MIDIETKLMQELSGSTQVGVAQLVSEYTNGRLGEMPQMLPRSAVEVLGQPIGMVALHDGEFAAYVGADQPEAWGGELMTEVGVLWVRHELRRQGIAPMLVKAIGAKLVAQGETPYAFCNPASEPIFGSLGYIAGKCEQVPPSAFTLCSKCPVKPAKGCCDQLMIYKGGAS